MATTLEQRPTETPRSAQAQVAATSFLSLFAIVGLALYGLPFFYDFMVRDFGWSRAQVTSGNAISKLVVGPLFGFVAGWFVDRVGPRRLMIVGILLAGTALVGLGSISTLTGFYVFYLVNALGNVLGGPLPNQVLLSRWFPRSARKGDGVRVSRHRPRRRARAADRLPALAGVRLAHGAEGAGRPDRDRRAAARARREGSAARFRGRRTPRIAAADRADAATCSDSPRSIC